MIHFVRDKIFTKKNLIGENYKWKEQEILRSTNFFRLSVQFFLNSVLTFNYLFYPFMKFYSKFTNDV